ncbi:MAG TPA: hypothetical protein DEB06_00645 [Phycisphaerales bacterium]|nr:hypothetical protein [Phycisphaerales bacterium]
MGRAARPSLPPLFESFRERFSVRPAMHAPLRILMTSLVDYAGLFPPAALDMRTTLQNWARYASGDLSWMLGRLIVPVARLPELARAIEAIGGGPKPSAEDYVEPWRLSAIVGEDLDLDIERVFEFNRTHAGESIGADPQGDPEHDDELLTPTGGGGIVIDAIEVKASSAREIDLAMRVVPEQLEPYFEIPITGDVRGLVAAMAGTGARAKVRTGGVTPEMIPAPKAVARFLSACAAADVPFKATAGLHHPMRAEYPLTYEPNCPRGVMFGFLNVFIAAALLKTGAVNESESADVLEERRPGAFVFTGAGVTWRDRRIDNARLARVRESFAVSFGSCSFDEPVADLRQAGLL